MTEKPLKDKAIHVSLGVLIASTLWVVGIFLNIGEKIGIAKSGGTEWQQEIEEQVEILQEDMSRERVQLLEQYNEYRAKLIKKSNVSTSKYSTELMPVDISIE